MNIKTIVEVTKMLDLNCDCFELTEKISYLEVIIGYDHWGEETTKRIFFDRKTQQVIPNYEEKERIKEQIKELEEQLKKLD